MKGDTEMTREQKVEWLSNATAEQLLAQYDRASFDMRRVFECSYLNFNEVQEDLTLTRAELLKRLSK